MSGDLLRRRMWAALAGIAAALPAALWLWHFMVDDALIIARYAHHLASGRGYRFNPDGPITDGVTPLGWPLLIAPLARGGVLSAFGAAKVVGLAAWLAGAAAIGVAIDRLELAKRKWLALLLLASSAPLAAWSVSGMETGVMAALGAFAAAGRALGREKLCIGCAALLSAWRPEAAPLSIAIALAPAQAPTASRTRWLKFGAVCAPLVAVALTRLAVFGQAAPLGALAKRSDLAHGARYALACWLLTGVVAAVSWRPLPAWARGLAIAVLAHFAAMAAAGGDWMPLSRLAVPALPAAVIVAAYAAGSVRPLLGYGRIALGLAGTLYVLVAIGPRARGVGARRLEVIEQLRPALADARVIAALDVGWVGAASAARIVDLAGVTDPAVATLPGGHTTKRVPHALLVAREVDTLVLLLAEGQPLEQPWTHSAFARYVELWVAGMPAMARDFSPVAESEGALRYVVLRRTVGD